jgi:hypothetical protein
MSFVRIANFVDVYTVDDQGTERVKHRYQNAAPGSVISHNWGDGNGTQTYQYLSFIYQGAAKSRTGDNLQAALVLSVNQLSQGISRQMLLDRDHVRVRTVVMEMKSDAVNRDLTKEEWLSATMTYDTTTVELILSSGIDAVGANAPNPVLDRDRVGPLPITGSIYSG